ncbi:MAG: hypothetical protein FJ395_18590 [Verrucomicrobia bacterium]|nr:hypothetical protein [Verrucomicrobiota bacterium]
MTFTSIDFETANRSDASICAAMRWETLSPMADSIVGILWVPLVNIAAYTIHPTGLAHLVREKIPKMRCVYMGDVV